MEFTSLPLYAIMACCLITVTTLLFAYIWLNIIKMTSNITK